MQEIELNSDATIMYGTARINWEQLYSAHSLLESQFSREMLMKFSFEPDRVTCLYNWRSAKVERSFLRLLNTIQTRATTDPRDRVFALLSHLSATKKCPHDKGHEVWIEADYNKSIVEVNMLVVKRLIRSSGRLDVLSHVRGHEAEVGLPTWAPMWNHRIRVAHSLLKSHVDFCADGHALPATAWGNMRTGIHDSEQLGPYHDHFIHQDQLHVTSISIGRVVWYFKDPAMEQYDGWLGQSDTRRSLRGPMKYSLSFPHGVLSALAQVETKLPMYTAPQVLKAFGEILTCGTIHPKYEGERGRREHASDYMAYRKSTIENHPDTPSPVQDARPVRRDRAFQNAIDYACEGRVLLCTDTGSLGLGPASLRLGHEVCIMRGGEVPYLLRQAKEHYFNLVGKCYIPGATHGELVSDSMTSDRKPTKRVIV